MGSAAGWNSATGSSRASHFIERSEPGCYAIPRARAMDGGFLLHGAIMNSSQNWEFGGARDLLQRIRLQIKDRKKDEP